MVSSRDIRINISDDFFKRIYMSPTSNLHNYSNVFQIIVWRSFDDVPLTQITVTKIFSAINESSLTFSSKGKSDTSTSSDDTTSDKLVEIEGARLAVEKERPKVEQQRLEIEQEKLNIDRQRFFIEQQRYQLYMAQLNVNLSQMGTQVAGQHR